MTDQTCKERVKENWESTKKDIFAMFKKGDFEGLSNYILSLDYIDKNTFKDQKKGYKRIQFSWGGPQDELRVYDNGKIEYWFLDWFDGACIDVTSDPVAQIANGYWTL